MIVPDKDDVYCPASTGVPIERLRCIISDSNHRCMLKPDVHPIHTCHCGAQWSSSAEVAKELMDA